MVERFVELVGTKERLDALYLLTTADIRATSPKVWTPWKAGLLETLYKSAVERLNGSEAEKSVTSIIDDRRARAAALVHGVTDATREKFWKELNLVYFMRHSAEEIAWHAEMLAERADSPDPVVRVKRGTAEGSLIVLLYLPDTKGLFLRAVALSLIHISEPTRH